MKSINDYLNDVEKKYGYERPQVVKPDYQEMSYAGKTDSEIENLVKAKIQSDFDSKKNELDYKNQTAINGVDSQLNSAVFKRDKLISDIESMFDKKKQDISDESLKRGLARSSIVLSGIADSENDRISTKADVMNDYSQRLLDLEAEKNSLSEKLEADKKSLEDDFSNKFLLEVEKEIANREKELQKVTDYNNSIKDKLSEYEERQAKLDMEYDQMLSSMNEKDREKMRNDKFQTAYSYYSGLEKSKIEDALRADMDILEKHLGDNAKMIWSYLKFKNII